MSGDIQRIIRLVYNVSKATEEAKRTLDELLEQSKMLESFAKQIRIEQRTDMEKWLEETLTILYELDRVDTVEVEGYTHYSIRNHYVNQVGVSFSDKDLARPLEEVQEQFVNKVLKLIQKPIADGQKVLVRKVPEYRLTEEGHHIFYCRLLIEKVTP